MTSKETSDFLKQLASGIQGGELVLDGESFEWDEIKKIKITFKNQQSRVMVKTKLKTEPATDVEMDFDLDDEPVEPEVDQKTDLPYKKLKKRMKQTLKTVHQSLKLNQMPRHQDLLTLLEDSRAMTSFQGYGDEYYPEFLEIVQQLEESHKLNDLQALNTAFKNFVGQMKHCHDRFK